MKAESVKARLKNMADRTGKTFQEDFTEDFYNDPMHQIRWNAFIRKKKALVQVELKDVIERIRRLALPVIEDIKSGSIQKRRWAASEEMWKMMDDNSENRY